MVGAPYDRCGGSSVALVQFAVLLDSTEKKIEASVSSGYFVVRSTQIAMGCSGKVLGSRALWALTAYWYQIGC